MNQEFSTFDGYPVKDATARGLITGAGRNYIFIGDSYAFNESAWIGKVVSKLGSRIGSYRNWAVSGAGFISPGGTWLETMQTNTQGLTAEEKAAITDIVVVGGLNDAQPDLDVAVLDLAIETFCNYCKANFPNANIHIGYCGSAMTNSTVIAGRTVPFRKKAMQTYATCAKHGACFIKGLENVMSDHALFGSDKLHPNTAGGENIANAIVQYLIGGEAAVKYYYSASEAAGSYGTYNELESAVDDNMSELRFAYYRYSPLERISSTYAFVDDLPETVLQNTIPYDVCCMANIVFDNTVQNEPTVFPVRLRVSNGNLYIASNQVVSDIEYQALTNIATLRINFDWVGKTVDTM